MGGSILLKPGLGAFGNRLVCFGVSPYESQVAVQAGPLFV